MIYFDVTKAAQARHHSGLLRVSSRLREELGSLVLPVVWRDGWKSADSQTAVPLSSSDHLITPELFSEAERPGFWTFLREKPLRLTAIFHDAIPLKFPQSTWPQSVARHPEYMKMLARFDRVLAVSDASRNELSDFWKWQGTVASGQVGRLHLGADFQRGNQAARSGGTAVTLSRRLLCIGILEPRKNQTLLVEAAAQLIAEGVAFELVFIGRVNPHFGKDVARKIRRLSSQYPTIRYVGDATDQEMEQLWKTARGTVFPTLAEGCGLPLIESLARGVPCICSDLPVLRENGNEGGCLFVATNERDAWTAQIKSYLTDDVLAQTLQNEAKARTIPSWSQAAAELLTAIGEGRA